MTSSSRLTRITEEDLGVGDDFERLLSEVGRLLDEYLRVGRQTQALNDGNLQKRQFELENRVEHLESGGRHDGSS